VSAARLSPGSRKINLSFLTAAAATAATAATHRGSNLGAFHAGPAPRFAAIERHAMRDVGVGRVSASLPPFPQPSFPRTHTRVSSVQGALLQCSVLGFFVNVASPPFLSSLLRSLAPFGTSIGAELSVNC
jgi:hypothetical protein